MSAIVVESLRKRYRDVVAVNDVTFDVRPGEFFGLLGPNGAGKTTTLELVEGLRRPDAGEVRVLGERPRRRNRRLLRRIGVQLQTSSLFERHTAREQLRVFAALYGVPAARADETLDLVGLSDSAGSRIERLSGGQAQRLSIACALVHDPELLFLDEPTAGLDPQARRNLWDLIRKVRADGRTVVLTTHHLDEAEALCDRVAIMDRGTILRLARPATLVRELDAPTRVSLESGVLTVEEARALPMVDRVEDDGSSLVMVTRSPGGVLTALVERSALRGLRVGGGTLEDVFLTLTGREYRQ